MKKIGNLVKGVKGHSIKKVFALTFRRAKCFHPPFQVWMELTNRCVFQCRFCVQDNMTRKKGFMEYDLFQKILKELNPSKTVIYLCKQGEPLLHPQVGKFMKYAVKMGFETILITNASLMNETKANEILEAGIDRVVFSFSGATKKTYEYVHRGANFEKTVDNLARFLLLKRKKGFNKPFIETHFIESEMNRSERYLYLTEFKKLPFDNVSVKPLINFFGYYPEIVLEHYKEYNPRSLSTYPVCTFPWEVLGISWNGNVSACLIDFDDYFILGNVYKDHILKIWNNEEMQKFRMALLKKRFSLMEKRGLFCSKCNMPWDTSLQRPYGYKALLGALLRSPYFLLSGRGQKRKIWEQKRQFQKKLNYQFLKSHFNEWKKNLMMKGHS